jgi:hypothetical protein
MNQHPKYATLTLPCERTQSTVERVAHCNVRISLMFGSVMFRYFLTHPPYAFDIRRSYVTTTGKTCFSFTIARTCLARSGTNNRRDVRKTFLGKQTYLHINRTQVTATRRHAIIGVVTISVSLHMQKSRSDLAGNEKTKF